MTLTLTLREEPIVPLEAEVLWPDRLAGASREEIEALPVWHGNERTRVGEFFAVSGAGDGDLRLDGDLSRVKFVGAGMTAGRLMLAGTIVAIGALGARAGAGMRRGSIVTMAPATPLATFVFSCIYRPPFLRLYLRRLRALGLAVSDDQLGGRYARWCGDGLELRRGEILILEET